MPNSENTLASALNELAGLGTERDRAQLAALLDRLDAARLLRDATPAEIERRGRGACS